MNGDLNQPVVTGRFYHADERPPLHKAGDILFEQRLADDTFNHLRLAANGAIFIQRDVTKREDNSEAKAGIAIDAGRQYRDQDGRQGGDQPSRRTAT